MPIFAGRTWLNRFLPRSQQVPLQPNPSLPFLIGSVQGGAIFSFVTIPVTRATSPGDTIVIGATSGSSATVLSITDSQKNDYRQVVTSGINSSNNSSYIWITTNPRPRALGLTDTITVNFSSAQASQYAVALDCLNYNLVDQTASAIAPSGTSISATTGTVTTPPELAIAVSVSGFAAGSPVWATNWNQVKTIQVSLAASISMAFNRINTAGPVTASASITSANWGISVATLQITQQYYAPYSPAGQTWMRRFGQWTRAVRPSQQSISPPSAPTSTGSLITPIAAPGKTWLRIFGFGDKRSTPYFQQNIPPPSPVTSAGTSMRIPIQPGQTWRRFFNLPDRVLTLPSNQAIAPPVAPTSTGTPYIRPANPGRLWNILFRPRARQIGTQQIVPPPVIASTGSFIGRTINPGRAWIIRFGERTQLYGTQQAVSPPSPSSSSGSLIGTPIQPGRTWKRKFDPIVQQYNYSQTIAPPVVAPSGTAYIQIANPGRSWRTRFGIRAQVRPSQQFISPPSATSTGSLYGVFANPGRTWRKRFLPKAQYIGFQQVALPPLPPVSTGSLQAQPISPGLTWSRRFKPRSQKQISFDQAFLPGPTANVSVIALAGSTNSVISAIANVSVVAQSGTVGPTTGPANVSLIAPPGQVIISPVAPLGTVSVTALAGIVTISQTVSPANVQVASSGVMSVSVPGAIANESVAALAGSVPLSLPGQTAPVYVQAYPGKVSFPDIHVPGSISPVMVKALPGSFSITLSGPAANSAVSAPAGSTGFALSGQANVSVIAPPGLVGQIVITGTVDDLEWSGTVNP